MYKFRTMYVDADKRKHELAEQNEMDGPVFTEIFTDTKQVWEPKSSTKRLEDGTLVSPPLEDLAPFLPRKELEGIMEIPLLPEN